MADARYHRSRRIRLAFTVTVVKARSRRKIRIGSSDLEVVSVAISFDPH
jgi:hypothetical protein